MYGTVTDSSIVQHESDFSISRTYKGMMKSVIYYIIYVGNIWLNDSSSKIIITTATTIIIIIIYFLSSAFTCRVNSKVLYNDNQNMSKNSKGFEIITIYL